MKSLTNERKGRKIGLFFFHPCCTDAKRNFIFGFPWAARGLIGQKVTVATATYPRMLSRGLGCVHRFCQASAGSKSGLQSAAALQNQLWLAEELFQHTQHFSQPPSSTCHLTPPQQVLER